MAGHSTGNGSGLDFATIKYNSSGVQQWVQRYNGTGNSTTTWGQSSWMVRNVYVTGGSRGIGTNLDAVTIKYNSNGIQQWIHRFNGTNSGNDVPAAIVLDASGNVYITVINYQLGISSNVNLIIYDILGNELAALVNENQNAGTYSVEWNAGSFSSGIFFYKLSSEGFVETKKMNLIK